ncbi:hypothetical protein ARMSODRAFT_973362 [Armillaria solidipes]|uniref:Uncharacterized protein n=1 Tax=Armillaria solidipes TaxID=1076256 RepID=A0A2H3C0E6_9AGAR|nr:hypothetical protein ARMSODRAFT_973362 [Armillaria solidipes]
MASVWSTVGLMVRGHARDPVRFSIAVVVIVLPGIMARHRHRWWLKKDATQFAIERVPPTREAGRGDRSHRPFTAMSGARRGMKGKVDLVWGERASIWMVQSMLMVKGPAMRAVEMIKKTCTVWRFESELLLKLLLVPMVFSSVNNDSRRYNILTRTNSDSRMARITGIIEQVISSLYFLMLIFCEECRGGEKFHIDYSTLGPQTEVFFEAKIKFSTGNSHKCDRHNLMPTFKVTLV